MKTFYLGFFLLSVINGFGQQTSFKVTYEDVPACYTTFTITDTSKHVLGSGKSDGTGTFSCDGDINTDITFILKAKPDKGKGWELSIHPGAVEGAAGSYEIKIEQVEALMNEAFDEQNKLLGGANDKNDEMNSESGSELGGKELGAIGGIVSMGQKAGKAQFTVIKASIGKSCAGGESKGKEDNKKESKNKESDNSNDEGELKSKNKEKESKEDRKEKEEAKKEQKELEKEKEEFEKEKEKVRKEREELEKEKAKEAEKEKKKKEEEEEEDDAPFKIYTPEELANMSSFDLKRTKLSNNQSIAKRKTKLKVKSAFYSEDKKKLLNSEIDALTKQVEDIKAVLLKRNEKPEE